MIIFCKFIPYIFNILETHGSPSFLFKTDDSISKFKKKYCKSLFLVAVKLKIAANHDTNSSGFFLAV